ncbi:related to triacylglycerol lipase V precursor [Cephalotrichum gorgonifer]|uniref:Carboxylic ester hydrolase n=1 Tax=Cephalotrichum gorgonifer TaxID=2041049 RepID=A0AAE8N7A6_9PEZI|nr:related to triacylglycerol lipase V precursor [Cephalotrichum gorgonifer]
MALGRALASPTLDKRAVEVTISNGTILGGVNGNVEFYKGIPFAEPPVGDLRFKHPLPFNSNFGSLDGTKKAATCMQAGTEGTSEDCLTLQVLRPVSVSASSKLPVAVFFHGGAFSSGGAEDGNDMTPIVEKSVGMNAPVILVSVQYRLGAFGFLAGKELAEEGNTNLGLRDQRLALQWVQDNIAAFGGDPHKVVIWGFSAGAMSVFAHSVINGGDAGGLFRGLITSSGSVLPTASVTSTKAQEVYNIVVSRAGCTGADSLQCLRALSADNLLKAASSLNMEFRWLGGNPPHLPRPDDSDSFYSVPGDAAVADGKYTKVPMLTGNSEDEGTLFALTQVNVTNDKILQDYLATYYPGNGEYARKLVSLYPDDLGISGAPYGTGLSNNVFGQYKRLASILGDITFIFQRRFHLEKISSEVPTWSYLSSSLHHLPIVGSMHGGDAMQTLSDSTSSPAVTQQRWLVSFINKLDPNALGVSPPLINLPRYTTSELHQIQLKSSANALVKDDYRMKQYEYWRDNISRFRL